jgi:hypothetical protein
MEADFRRLFSQAFGCPPEQFEQRMFRKTLFRHAIPFFWFIRDRGAFFREDLEMLRDIASARTTPEVICELNRFYGRNHRDKNFVRTSFFIRVSGKRVLRIYRALVLQRAAHEAPLPDAALQPLH